MQPMLCAVCLSQNENGSLPFRVFVETQDDGAPEPYAMPWSNHEYGHNRMALNFGAAAMVAAYQDDRVIRGSFRSYHGDALPMEAVAIVGMSSRCWLHLNIAWPADPYNSPRRTDGRRL